MSWVFNRLAAHWQKTPLAGTVHDAKKVHAAACSCLLLRASGVLQVAGAPGVTEHGSCVFWIGLSLVQLVLEA